MRCVILTSVALMLTAVQPAALGDKPPPPARKLWAGVRVDRLVRRSNNLPRPFMVTFSLVNDGEKTVDPKVGESDLVINGKKMEDWRFTASNGPRDARWQALPPGGDILFGYDLHRHFTAPGTYRVVWKGDGYESAEVVFRVLPPEPPGQ